jgi:hypothetical protein
MGESRFTVISQPVALPGCCFLCRSATNGPFVDTKFSIKFEGAVIVCAACIRDMNNQLPKTEEIESATNKAFVDGYEKATEESKNVIHEQLALFNSNFATLYPAVPEFDGVPQDSGLTL